MTTMMVMEMMMMKLKRDQIFEVVVGGSQVERMKHAFGLFADGGIVKLPSQLTCLH